jgi:hypothetical protein
MSSQGPHSNGLNSPGLNSTGPPRRRSRWTDVLLTACGLFVLTVFLMLASALDPNAGLLARFFDRNGLIMLGVEVGAILLTAIIVLIVERRETGRRIHEREAALLKLGDAALEPSEAGHSPAAQAPHERQDQL